MKVKHVIGAFEKRETAEALLETLQQHVPRERMSLITKPEDVPEQDKPPKVDLPIDGGLIGAAAGGTIGLAFVAGSLAAGGATPLLSSWGPLAGILYGGMSGGALGGLIDIGINPASAKSLVEAVSAGKTVLSAEIPESEAKNFQKIFYEFGADIVALQD